MGEMHKLRKELEDLCGITPLEALNVLIYRNVRDYIGKYNTAEYVCVDAGCSLPSAPSIQFCWSDAGAAEKMRKQLNE